MEYKDIIPWVVCGATTYGLWAASNWYERNHEKVSEYIFWKIINPIRSGSLKKNLKEMQKKLDQSELEKKL